MQSPEPVATTQRCVGNRTHNVVVNLDNVGISKIIYTYVGYFVGGILLYAVAFSFIWIHAFLSDCHKPPGVSIEAVSIRELAVLKNTSDSARLVRSDFDLTLSTWNRNTVAKCFTTCREMDVAVRYKGEMILRQEVLLWFTLKPKEMRGLTVTMKGEQATLRQPLGLVLERNIYVEFYFNIRYLIADRRSRWKRFKCVVVTTTPHKSSGPGRLPNQSCHEA